MDIRVLFVLPEDCKDENEASEIMLQAYESCRQNVVNVAWIKQSEFQTTDFTKTDFVIFQEFKGPQFESLKESKCARILGPWCVFVCLMQGRPIPNFTWPIYNVAMSGCVISCSHIPKAKKNEIREKVQLMGGCYTDNLMSTNTHLVTESVKSEKYLQAAESGVKLFRLQWVDAVWEASQNNNIHCDDEQFFKYKCLPFHNLTISSTGLPNVEMRTEIASIIANNGGIFTANLALSTTDVLIVHGENGILSKKYKAARSTPNIYCVSLDWVHESIEKGYALPHNLYAVQTKGTSTPTKDDEVGPNFSIISAIGDITSRYPTQIDDTMAPKKLQPATLFPPKISPNKRKGSESDEVDKIIEGLDIKKAKKAGQYLDGCSVYLAGFKPDQRDKLCRILNLSGATRYDDISERLTHIIVGNSSCPEVKIIKSKNYPVCLVSVNWLLESMEKQQAADEDNYLINLHEFSKEQFNSPLGKKGLNLLRTNKTLTPKEVAKTAEKEQPSQEIQIEDELMQQYLKPTSKIDDSDTLAQLLKNNSSFATNRNPTDNSKGSNLSNQNSEYTDIDNATSQESRIFDSKKFVVINFSFEDFQNIKDQIESVLGTVMPKNYKGIPDYVVAPAFITTTIQISGLEIVNNYWINECLQECDEIAIEYYHRPLVVTESKPLENCVVTTSGYTGYERVFIKELIEALGGVSQEQFARVLCIEKNVKASTHLVSLEADGKKYAAALKWALPVITKDWLFECAKTGKLVPEEKFLMGDSKAPSRSNKTSDISDVKNKNSTPLRAACNVDQKTPSSMISTRKVLTPVCQIQAFNSSKNEKTPVNQRLFDGIGETPCSQVTPINKLMEEVRKTNLLGTPQTPPLPKTWYDVDTPESPFGACIKPHLSPKSKKELVRYINRFPDFVPPPKQQKSTPLSEVKRRCWQKLLGSQESPSRFTSSKSDASTSQLSLNSSDINEENNRMEIEKEEGVHRPDETMTNEQNAFINTKLKQIEEMVSAISENRRSSRTFQQPTRTEEESKAPMKDSQPFTVGWDYEEDRGLNKTFNQDKPRIFIISGVENEQRQIIVEKIENLGGQVSELNTYDPNCTHLICPKPARNEKTLSCMASGKWILHISYVDKCVAEGKFLAEEEFEFGNPKSKDNIKTTFDKENEFRLQSIYWWRQEISRRGYGAFNDMRAIVVAQKRDPIVRVIEAGGGQVIDAKPPFKDNIHATHCFLEPRSVSDFSVYTPLAQQGILCINTLYISDYLFRTSKDVMDAVVPHFSRFYS